MKKEPKFTHSTEAQYVSMADLLKAEGLLKSNRETLSPKELEMLSLYESLEEAGSAGFPCILEKGDIIFFEGKGLSVKKFVTADKKTVPIVNLPAWCERLGSFDFPVAIVRRIPIDEEIGKIDVAANADGRALINLGNDLRRALTILKKASDSVLKVEEMMKLHKPRYIRSDKGFKVEKYLNEDGTIDYGKLSGLRCYIWKWGKRPKSSSSEEA